MKNRTLMLIALTLLAAGLAHAGDETTVTGFVDASWSMDGNSETQTFGLDQVEVDVIREMGDGVVLRADLEWVKDGDGWAQDVEQGFLSAAPEFLQGAVFTLGKFNAPIGFELLDAPDMYQFSHALVFDHGLPTNLTGGMLAKQLTEDVDVTAYWVNGWDANQANEDTPKTFGGRVGYALGELGGLGLSVITGKEMDAGADVDDPADDFEFDRTVVDVDLTLTPAEGWLLGGEFNKGTYEALGVECEWTGMLVMANRAINDWLGLTVRFDWMDDPDGYVFGNGEDTRTAFTVAPTFALGDGLGALFELRQDMSDNQIWVDADGAATDSALTAAFEMTYTF